MLTFLYCPQDKIWIVDTFAWLFISYSIFKLSTIVLKKELKVSASSSFLVIVSSVSLLIFVMGSFWYAFSENSGFTAFQNFLFSYKTLLSKIPHINSETNPIPPWSMLLASIWGSFLAQASVSQLCQYAATLSRGKWPDLFL